MWTTDDKPTFSQADWWKKVTAAAPCLRSEPCGGQKRNYVTIVRSLQGTSTTRWKLFQTRQVWHPTLTVERATCIYRPRRDLSNDTALSVTTIIVIKKREFATSYHPRVIYWLYPVNYAIPTSPRRCQPREGARTNWIARATGRDKHHVSLFITYSPAGIAIISAVNGKSWITDVGVCCKGIKCRTRQRTNARRGMKRLLLSCGCRRCCVPTIYQSLLNGLSSEANCFSEGHRWLFLDKNHQSRYMTISIINKRTGSTFYCKIRAETDINTSLVGVWIWDTTSAKDLKYRRFITVF